MTLRRLFVAILAVPIGVFLLAAGSAVLGTVRDTTDHVRADGDAQRDQIIRAVTRQMLTDGLNGNAIVRRLTQADKSLSAVELTINDATTKLGTKGNEETESKHVYELDDRSTLTIYRPKKKLSYIPTWRLSAAGFSLLAMAVALALVLAQLVEHLLNLSGAMARELKRGNYRAKIPTQISREFQHMADDLNALADSLRARNKISSGYLVALRGKNDELERQISDRVQAEEALADEKTRLQVTLSSLAEGVIATDTEGQISLISTAACELTGWTESEALGKPLGKVYNVADLEADPASTDNQTLRRRNLLRPDGATKLIADSTAPIRDDIGEVIGSVLVLRDVTAEARMEEELVRSQKHETTARLAGGIAHDFNNILTAVVGNISLARMDLAERHGSRQLLAEAEAAATRARDLTRQLLILTRSDRPFQQNFSISDVARAATEFCMHGSSVVAKDELPGDLWTVQGDADQIHQVVQNLVLNANQAMPTGGTLYVEGENVTLESGSAYPVPAGTYVKISIRDTGVGLNPSELKQALDPFFTTRKRASGLGLPVAYSIMRNHGGHLELASNEEKGITATILLPATPSAAAPQTKPLDPISATPDTPEGKRILLMDDEDAIRLMVRRGLTRYGYHVVTSPHGADAIQKFQTAQESGHPYDAVILDLTIPGGIGGVECLRRIQDVCPEVLAIVASGYAQDVQLSDFDKLGFRDYLRKPYRIDELSDVLRTHLSK